MTHHSKYSYYNPKVVYTLKKKCSSKKFSLNFSEENKQYRNLSYFSYFYLLFYPTPSNLTSFWNFGFLSFIFLFIQIITGIFLSMHYVAEAAYAFDSVAQIMRDVEYGWLARYMHANGASFFFFLVYLHMGRSMYNFSYLLPRRAAWSIGVLIYFLMILTAFTGYVLPWGQMSFWAATVITNLTSAVPIFGQSIVTWLWGGYSVSTVTLNRFFSIHYLLPFIIFALVIIHVIVLHHKGSSNRLGIFYSSDKIRFGPYYLIKDFVALLITLDIYFFFVGFYPNVLGHPDNFIKADPLVTPAHIVPEWYFLPFYAMLRSIPSKLIGVIVLFLAILILFAFPFFLSSKTIAGFAKKLDYQEILFSKLDKSKKSFFASSVWWLWKYRLYILFWIFADIVILLGILGAKPIEYPYYGIGQVLTFFYFFYFFLLIVLFDERLLNNSKIVQK